jgi:hypothetical protein
MKIGVYPGCLELSAVDNPLTKGSLRLYKMDEVQNEIDRQMLEKAQGALKQYVFSCNWQKRVKHKNPALPISQ